MINDLENEQIEFDSIINKLKEIAKIPNDRQLCFKLNILTPSFSNSKKRGVIPYKKIINFCKKEGISLDLLFENNNIQNIVPKYTKKESNAKNIYNIPLVLDENNFVRLPFEQILNTSTLKAYFTSKFIYVIDISSTTIEHDMTYLIKAHETYYVRHISIDFDGMYSIKDEKGYTEKLTKEVFSKINILGKIVFLFHRENL